MSFSNFTALVVLASTATCYILWKNKRSDTDSLLPPRAPGYIPIIGHILELIRPIPIHELFYKWSLQVGPVFTCYFGTQKWIVINSIEAVRDLMVERGTIYSSRNLPDTITQDIFQGDEGGSFAFMTYGPRWRHLRRIAHSGLIKNKIDLYQPILNERRTALLSYIYKLLEDKKGKYKGIDISYFIEHYTITSILTIAFGDICSFEPKDPTLHKAFNLTERASKALSPGDQLREFFPILKVLWPAERTRYFQLRDDIVEFYDTLLNQFRAQKSTQDCFVKEIMKKDELNDLQIIYFIALFVGAGSDTTASTIEWAIAYLANHPEVQDLAYNEIKEEVGLDRLPEYYDESNLPFVQCIILETLRMRPPAPTAIPHATSEDDIYKGWHIPKNTIVLMNLFAIHNNPSRFPNPSHFQPERHLEYVRESQHNRKLSQIIEDRPHLGFSTGRRACVGIHLAERKLFMAMSMLLACFKIERISEDLIDVNAHKDVHGVTWAIPHYKIQLIPRHDKVATFFR